MNFTNPFSRREPQISMRDLASILLRHERRLMTTLEQATSDLGASIATLTAELTSSNTKVDQLIALAQASGAPQASIDAIVALKATVDSATAAQQAEDAKVAAVLTPAPVAPDPTVPVA